MKYTAKTVNTAVSVIIEKTRTDPALIRKRMESESEVFNNLTAFCEYLAYKNGIEDEQIVDDLVNCAIYGFILREEVATTFNSGKKIGV